MTVKEVKKIIEEGESFHTEFKRKFSTHEKIAKEIIAFANSNGGRLFLGVDDDASIVGVESEKESAYLISQTASDYCQPAVKLSISVIELYGKDIVIAEIPESQAKPHRIQNYKSQINYNTAKVFIRMHSKSVQASKEMIKFLHTSFGEFEEMKFNFGDKEKALFGFLERKDKISTKEFCKLVNISERRAQRILIKLVRMGVIFLHQEANGRIYFTPK